MSRRSFDKDVEEVKSNLKDAQKGIYDYFGLETKSRRSRLSERQEIMIDPASLIIGAFGAAAVGLLADEVRERAAENGTNESGLNGTIARIIAYPIKSVVRMATGGCVYVAVDNITLQAFDRRWPCVSGAVTAACFANGGNLGVFVGSVLGLAVFAHVSDVLFDAVYNR
ncbi:unnamed protein product [Orchesella dallaii]|uniref:Mitochondrial import inner membrane translocase subunit TIM22 n=1 Tax=Orchesella dallaii TaxID=48710 RepID=A0ABP1QA82_9HEXA